MKNILSSETICRGAIAGAAGGLAEILWVTIYAVITGGNAAILARGVTTASGIGALVPAASVELGIAVHMALAVMLGIALAFAWRSFSVHRSGSANPYPFMFAALTGIWVLNFFVVLPVVSPAFVNLTPYAASLTSKLLFALAAAAVLRHEGALMKQAGSASTSKASR